MPRITIFRKIVVVTLLLSLLPLLASSLFLLSNLETVNSHLTEEIANTSDLQAAESLQMRAQHIAETISDFLRQCEGDLLFLANTNPDKKVLTNFYVTRRNDIWKRFGTSEEIRELLPLYRTLAFIDKNGKERLVIKDGLFLESRELRDVSTPAGTEFKTEEYFQRIKALRKGEIYVSHLTGYHVSKQDQLVGTGDPESAVGGAHYDGVIRFGTPLIDSQGNFNGMVVISLDHRHLMEFTQHVDPGKKFSTVFPSYKSGNYAFLFDDEGWIITHPKFWDIRGLDRNGQLIAPYTASSRQSDIDSGRIPFNLDQAGFIHSNYPQVTFKVRNHQAGYVDITNVGGAKKVMSFAPIPYSTGDYSKYGIFGAVTIGFQVNQFHDAARKGSRLIHSELKEHRRVSALILLATALVTAFSAWLLSRGITRPLHQLIEGARNLAEGDLKNGQVTVSSTDELGELANTFNFMANELKVRKMNLLTTLDELRRSRLEILDERNFKESILESISSAIVTFSPEGYLTSINGTGLYFLGNHIAVAMHFKDVFSGWNGVAERTELALATHTGFGRQGMKFDRHQSVSHFDIGFFPIGKNAEKGLTVTLRNETEKEKLREEMTRLDRLASLGKLSAGIAHEVRNPLTGISLLLDDLYDNTPLDPGDKNMIKKALMEIERVERLITALLNYSSPPRADFRVSDLNTVINDTILLMGRQCGQQKIRITFIAGAVTPFRFDPEKIKQGIINITRNALEALPQGGNLIFSTATRDDYALITISDDGPGIAEADLPLIFEPFFTRKGAGTGLGLSITQRIIEEHNGQIRVESSPTSGTKFIIELPLLLPLQ